DVHRAGAALGDAAPILGAGEADLLADHPQERRVRLHVHIMNGAIDIELCHWVLSPVLPFAAELVFDWCAGVWGKPRSWPTAPGLLIRRAIDQERLVAPQP